METCDLISLIDGLFLAITIFSALGVITTLAGSIIGCLGTCCGKNQVRHFISCRFKDSCQGFQWLVHILSRSSFFLNFYYPSIIYYLQHTQDFKLEREADKFWSISRFYTAILFQSVARLFFVTCCTSRTRQRKTIMLSMINLRNSRDCTLLQLANQ